jgi:hypothetical protein
MTMKILAIHDATGSISEIIAAPEDGPTVGITPRAGQTITEVNISDHLNVKNKEDIQELAEMIHKYRVVVESKTGRLERHSDVD